MTDKPKTSLSSIPPELTMGMLKRMPTETIVRMRRTCSTINNLIEENSEKLASRPYLGIEMRMSTKGYAEQLETVAYTAKGDGYLYIGNRTFPADGRTFPFEAKMSAISFSKIIVMLSAGLRVHISVLRRLKPMCHTLCVDRIPRASIFEIMDYVEFEETSGLPFTWKSGELEILSQARKRSKFCIKYDYDEDRDAEESEDLYDILGKVKNFKRVTHARTTCYALKEFLWDLYKLNERIPLKSIELCYFIGQRTPFKSPPFYMFRKVRGYTVHLMVTPLQFVLIFDRYNSAMQIVLVEKDEAEVVLAIRSHGVQFEEEEIKAELRNYVSSLV